MTRSGHRPGGKHFLPCLLIALAFTTAAATTSVADPTAILVGDTAMVPLRATFEWLGASVQYDDGRIVATRGGTSVALRVGSRQAMVDGRAASLSAAPTIRDGSTYIPLRFVAEAFAAGVRYDAAGRQVEVTDSGRSLVIGIAGSDPVRVALSVFRSFMATGGSEIVSYGTQDSQTAVFFAPDTYPWMREARQSGWSYWSVDPNGSMRGEADVRFMELLRSLGWSHGAPWFPYWVNLKSPTTVAVQIGEWNWGTTVRLAKRGGTWAPVTLEADGEGNEGNPPLQWRVSPSGARYTFTRI